MKLFAELFNELDQTTKTNAKVEALVAYFQKAIDQDALWTIALLSHKRPKRTVSTKFLRQWAAEVAGIPDWLFEDAYHTVGDLAETISLLVTQTHANTKSLHQWILELKALKTASEEEKKAYILSAWASLDTTERFLFNKIITGGFRVGVSQKLMVRSLAKVYGLEENSIAHRLMGNWEPETTTLQKLLFEEDKTDNLSRPYPFMLAYPWEKEVLGDLNNWQAEYKWDGIRAQLIKREDTYFLWSRGEELITDRFPEIIEAAQSLPEGLVLDGEILPFKDGQVLDFQALQTRIGRKNVTKKLLEEVPVVFIAYDVLEANHKDIRPQQLSERRQLLESFLNSSSDALIRTSALITASTWGDLKSIQEKARAVNAEGLMLKRKDLNYEVGRKKGIWYKWKVDPYTIDAVLTYAMKGHGRRANLYTDYTFALWDKGELVTVAKAYSGLTDAELRQVDNFVKKNTLERFGPVRQVLPQLVFELAFEGVAASKRHKSGVAVRFPRIHRWRHDKKIEEANTIEDLKNLI